MEDLLAKMQEILNSEEGQQQMKSVAEMLGVSSAENMAAFGQHASGQQTASEQQENTSGMDLSALNELLGNLMGQNHTQPPPNSASTSSKGMDNGGLDLNLLLQVQKILSTIHEEDDNTRLLMALRPHFSEQRQEKVDQAVKMLRLLSVLPMLKDSGLLGGLFGNGR